MTTPAQLRPPARAWRRGSGRPPAGRGGFAPWPALVLLAATLALSAVAASPLPRDLTVEAEVAAFCRHIVAAGIFNSRSLTCFPALRREAEKALCRVGLGETFLSFGAGFGLGPSHTARDLPSHLDLLVWRQPVHRPSWRAWRQERCGGEEPRQDLEARWTTVSEYYETLDRTRQAFAASPAVRSAAPASLIEPWESCTSFHAPLIAPKAGVRCRAIAGGPVADDPSDAAATPSPRGDDGVVYFSVQRILPPAAVRPPLLPIPRPSHFAPKLKRDLEVTGAACEGPAWEKGMRVRGVHTLRCRRLGTRAVTFRLTTSKGGCSATLPELTEPPWEEVCRDAGAGGALEEAFPFLTVVTR